MPNLTVSNIIKSSMRKIGVLAAGEALPASEGQDALEAFRMMIDSWALEHLLIPVVKVVTHTLDGNYSNYTIGIYPSPAPDPLPVNHIETARPEQVLSAFIRDGHQTDYPIEMMGINTHAEISRKTNSSRPSRMYIRKGWPLNTIILDSLPYDNETLHLELLQPLSEVLPASELTEVINLPPGYKKVLVYNLAIDLADEWDKDISNTIALSAVEGKKWLKRSNYRSADLKVDRALISKGSKGTYDINGGP